MQDVGFRRGSLKKGVFLRVLRQRYRNPHETKSESDRLGPDLTLGV